METTLQLKTSHKNLRACNQRELKPMIHGLLVELFSYIDTFSDCCKYLRSAAIPQNRSYHNITSLLLTYIFIFLHNKNITGFVKNEITKKTTFLVIISRCFKLQNQKIFNIRPQCKRQYIEQPVLKYNFLSVYFSNSFVAARLAKPF